MGAAQQVIDAKIERCRYRAQFALAVERNDLDVRAGSGILDPPGNAGQFIERQADVLESDMADSGP